MSDEIVNRTREHILAEIYLGHVRRGDRLPSIRELARKTGVDQRRIARIYRELEHQHLIEIRGRSGVYVGSMSEEQDVRLSELQGWAVSVAMDAWARRVGMMDLPGLFRELTQTVELKCLFVESSDDQIQQFSTDLRADFGLNVNVYKVPPETRGRRVNEHKREIRKAAADVDFLATTVFHAALVEEVAALAGKAVVIITLSDAAVMRLERLLQYGPVTIVAVDPNHKERITKISPELTGRLSVISVDEADALSNLESDRLFCTRAVKDLQPNSPWQLLFPYDLAVVSSPAARQICGLVISRNVESAHSIKERILRGATPVP